MYKFDLLELKNFEIIKTEDKCFYNSDTITSLTEWVKLSSPKTSNKVSWPNFSSPLNVKDSSDRKMSVNSLGWFSCGTNTVERNNIDIGLSSAPYSHKGTSGFEICGSNFFKIIGAFSARNLIRVSWSNTKDIYLAPQEETTLFNEFKVNSLIISLFANSSGQSSLRQVTYAEQLWDIKNEFFWISKEEMMELANNNNYNELYVDARTDNNRYVHNLLFGEQNIYEQLSPDAKLVLDKATELTRMSMTMRSHFADDHNHLNSWDAGYAQLKLVWKEYFPDEFKEFRQLYKNLEDRMRPLVYELGFLLK